MTETIESATAGWREVDKDTFYATMGPLDVHPTPVGRWNQYGWDTGYLTLWKLRNGRAVGREIAGRYWVP